MDPYSAKLRLIRSFRQASKYAYARYSNRHHRRELKSVVFVAGVQRSGTNMVMDFYDHSLETTVFHETDERMYQSYGLRPWTEVKQQVAKAPSHCVVLKALLEAHELARMLREFAPAKVVWIFRHYEDMVNSYLRSWPGGRNQIERIVEDPASGEWRGKGMTPKTHAILKTHYDPAMSDASAIALFWYYRNQLIFDQGLDRELQCRLVLYDELVQSPETYGKSLAEFADIAPNPSLWSSIYKSSVRKQPAPEIAPDVRDLAEQMLERLKDASHAAADPPSGASRAAI